MVGEILSKTYCVSLSVKTTCIDLKGPEWLQVQCYIYLKVQSDIRFWVYYLLDLRFYHLSHSNTQYVKVKDVNVVILLTIDYCVLYKVL